MDGTALLESLGGDREILEEVVGVFLQACPEQLAAVERSVTSHDAPGLAANAHRLKGAVSIFGAEGATDAALRLEMAGMSGNLGGIRRNLPAPRIRSQRARTRSRRRLLAID